MNHLDRYRRYANPVYPVLVNGIEVTVLDDVLMIEISGI